MPAKPFDERYDESGVCGSELGFNRRYTRTQLSAFSSPASPYRYITDPRSVTRNNLARFCKSQIARLGKKGENSNGSEERASEDGLVSYERVELYSRSCVIVARRDLTLTDRFFGGWAMGASFMHCPCSDKTLCQPPRSLECRACAPCAYVLREPSDNFCDWFECATNYSCPT
jgi:hypothetical protein